MNVYQTETPQIEHEDNQRRDPEIQQLSESQLKLVGGGNVIIIIA
jgi:hypothetical protein